MLCLRSLLLLIVALAGLGTSTCGRPPVVPVLAIGQAVAGTLTADDTDAYEGVTADAVDLYVEPDEPMMVVVTSEEIAPFAIAAVRGTPLGAASGEPGGRGACLTLGAPHSLDVRVYVSSAGGEPYGDYQVEAEPWTAERARALGCEAPPQLPTSPRTLV